jgi:DNA-binding CsgD family transcriptional regulator
MSSPSNQTVSLKEFASLAAALMRGPLQDAPWSDFLKALRHQIPSCLLVIGLELPQPGDAGIAFIEGGEFSPADKLGFANKHASLDPLQGLPDGKLISLDDVIPREKLKETDFYQMFMKPLRHTQIIGFDVHRKGKLALYLRIIRDEGAPDFSAQERATLELLIPLFRELAHWMEHNRSHTREHSLYEQAFSTLAVGTVILDDSFKIVFTNRVADQLLENNEDLTLHSGKLRLPRQHENQNLQHVLQSLLADEAQAVPQVISVQRAGDAPPLYITARRLSLQDQLESKHHIALYMTDPELRQIDQTQLVMQAFNLTKQEARLVIALANGGTLEDFSSETGVSKNTARSHLYSSFRKVGVTQQSALVSHVIRAIYGL